MSMSALIILLLNKTEILTIKARHFSLQVLGYCAEIAKEIQCQINESYLQNTRSRYV